MPQVAAAAVFQVAGWAATALGASSAGSIAVANAAVATAAATAKVALMTGINKAIAHQNKPEPQGHMVNIAVSPDEPRRLMIGKRMTGGVLVDWYVRGSKNQNLYFVIYLGEGPMGRVTKLQAGGRTVYSNPINHGVRTVIPNFRSGGDRLWVTYYDGRPGQTADANLVSKGLGWSSSCRGTGMAYAVVEMQWDSDNLTSPVQLSFELEGAKLYDRRKDSTAGGTGSHRLTDPGTWELSSNPAVACDHYMLGRYVNGVKTFGIGIDPDDVPFDRFASLANLCDESVSISGGGTQTRYESNGFLFADRSYKDTILDLCRSMNARPADFGGRISILDGQPRAPVLSIDDADMLEEAQEQYVPKRSWAALVSGVEGRFIPASQNYQPVDYARVADATWAAEDAGQPKWATLDLEMETDHERAQRLAWLYVKRERRQAQLTGIYPLWAIELEQGDWFTRTGGKFGAGKNFEVLTRTLDPQSMTVTITAFEVDPSDTAWNNTIASGFVPDPVEGTGILPPLPQATLTAAPNGLSASDGSAIPGVGLTINYGTDAIAVETQIEIARDDGTGSPSSNFEILTRTAPAGRSEQWFAGDLLPGTNYVYRGRSVLGEQHGDWSAWQPFTAPDIFTAKTAIAATPGGTLATQMLQMTSRLTSAEDDIDLRATITQVDTIETSLQSAIAQSESSLRSDFQTADASLQSLISNEAQARSSADSAIASDVSAAVARISLGESLLVKNPFYRADANNGLPSDWNHWVNSGNRSQIMGLYGANIYRETMPATDETGVFQVITNITGGMYVITARVRLESGSYIGAGVHCSTRNSSNSVIQSDQIRFGTHADVNGTISATAGGVRTFSRTVYLPAATSHINFYAMTQYNSLGAATKKTLDWYELSITPADDVVATAAILKEAFVSADGEAYAGIRLVAEASGSTPATVELVSGDGGSAVRLGGDTEIDGDLLVTGSITSANGFAANSLTSTVTDESTSTKTITTSWQNIADCTITVGPDEEVDLSWSMAVAGAAAYSSNSTGGYIYVRLLRGTSVEIYWPTPIGYMPASNQAVRLTPSGGGNATLYDLESPVFQNSHAAGSDFDAPPPGTHIYIVQVKKSGGHWTISNPRFKATKRGA